MKNNVKKYRGFLVAGFLLSGTLGAMERPSTPMPQKAFQCSLCPECRQRFSSQGSLKLHMNREHTEGRTDRTCDQCQETFTSYGRLMFHKKRIHNKQEAPLSCTKCGKKYRNKACFLKHLRKHEELTLDLAAEALTSLAITPPHPPAAAAPALAHEIGQESKCQVGIHPLSAFETFKTPKE